MALTSQITAVQFPPFGRIGESSGFTPFSEAQLLGNDLIVSTVRTVSVSASSAVSGEPTENDAITEIVDNARNPIDAYLTTLFTDTTKTYTAKIYIVNVVRPFNGSASVDSDDRNSNFVQKDDNFIVSYRVEVLVA